ncbi:hypothetical protein ACKC9G_03325 [Pokkaliibacter sp. CJK22405]|uniref:hypothetical protein n=1 Tax=Pokkaliibacter sp. CJK22405 TaxID=3384615 RepID=UPI003984C894
MSDSTEYLGRLDFGAIPLQADIIPAMSQSCNAMIDFLDVPPDNKPVFIKRLHDGAWWRKQLGVSETTDPQLAAVLQRLQTPQDFVEAMAVVRERIRYVFSVTPADELQERHKEQLLLCLYWLATLDSFYVSRSEVLDAPGMAVIRRIPDEERLSLSFCYDEVGYDKLRLVTEEDKAWFIERWGIPDSHDHLNALYREIWDNYEQLLLEEQGDELTGSGIVKSQSVPEGRLPPQFAIMIKRHYLWLVVVLVFALVLYIRL